ncbi:RNA polymerase sigma factor [Spirosoma sordidisoli]|uniref:RNA polymerase sigma factor n=1 Tax=Spirosoma sordidisoli TaxID=2502893 RepID=A0A4Q2USP4_9BACT|nr:RNA polymerase sigma factor [Spirosoma sordidisoli]RYC70750.1 RNA polymerase sigma factor [Spirosoma sordidisoli]
MGRRRKEPDIDPASDWPQLIAAHAPFIRHAARRFLTNSDDAQDLAQDVMVRVLLNEKNFDRGTDLKAWLYCIVRNMFITAYQRKKRVSRVDLSDELYSGMDVLGSVESGADELMHMQSVLVAVNGLVPRYREPLLLFIQGWMYEEIAAHIGLPVGTVKNRIHVARKYLHDNREQIATTTTLVLDETPESLLNTLCTSASNTSSFSTGPRAKSGRTGSLRRGRKPKTP